MKKGEEREEGKEKRNNPLINIPKNGEKTAQARHHRSSLLLLYSFANAEAKEGTS